MPDCRAGIVSRKGLPDGGVTGCNLLRGDLPFPALALRESMLARNIEAMATWLRTHGFQIAPHGKTTMCPQIFRRQLAAGAWGITVATSTQALIAADAGSPRVLIANQLIGVANIRSLRAATAELYCLIDSLAALDRLDAEWRGAVQPMGVLIEVGRDGWRTGVRSNAAALELHRELRSRGGHLRFAGLEAFEGSAHSEAEAEEFVRGLIDVARGFPAEERELLFSVGGSAYLGVLARTLPDLPKGWQPLLRSGCYVTHDHGYYDQRQIDSAGEDAPRFEGALELWGVVQSKPEPGLAIVSFGKRDCSYDLGLPVPLDLKGGAVTALNDQHAFLKYPGELRVGDALRFGISHPCTTFDKWREIAVVDDDYNVIDVYQTCF